MGNQPTIFDVAKLAKVAPSTVSRYLNSSSYVANETKKKIEIAVKKLQYRPSRFAKNLRSQSMFNVSVVVPDLNWEFYGEIVDPLSIYATLKGVEIIVSVTHDIEKIKQIVFDFAFTRRIDGVILCTPDSKTVETFSKLSVPVIAIDWENMIGGDLEVDTINIDNKRAAFMAMDYLYSKGHKEILVITGGNEIQSSLERVKGVMLFSERHTGTKIFVFDGDFTPNAGYNITKTFLKSNKNITAIFAFNDLMAFGALNALTEKGLKVPDDISIMGFDNSFISKYTFPSLTTVDQPKDKIGIVAAQLIMDRLNAQRASKTRDVVIPFTIIERNSVKELK